jgi:hypothetical protein
MTFDSDFLDRYVRGELSEEDESEFEIALLDSPELQAELQTVLAIRQALRLDAESEPPGSELSTDVLQGANNWQPFALAASLLLAVFSTTMYWKVSNETASLQQQLESFKQPNTDVVTVSIDIMRSSGNRPAAIIQKPAPRSLMILEIELGEKSREQTSVRSSLKDESDQVLSTWTSEVMGWGGTSVAFLADNLPDGQVWLEIADVNGELLERRLLEFLPAKSDLQP